MATSASVNIVAQNRENVNPSAENSFEESFGKDVKHRARDTSDEISVYRSMLSEGIKIEPTARRFADNVSLSPAADIGSVYSIADLFNVVKRFDSDFKPIPVNKDLLNADGTPKLFYHGAKSGGGFSGFRDWSYFTENRAYAERYSQKNTEATRLPQGAKAPPYLRVTMLLPIVVYHKRSKKSRGTVKCYQG